MNLFEKKSLKRSVEDIDLYAGLLAENKTSDSYAVAPTFGCLIMEQFSELKKGDRFYYENDGSSSPNPFTSSILLT